MYGVFQFGLIELIVRAEVGVRGTKLGKTSFDGGLNGTWRVANAFNGPTFVCLEKKGGLTIN